MSEPDDIRAPLHVAVIGSGPAGFYAAEHLLKSRPEARVDVFDRLPTPFGLVRGGVAPDHPKIKSVTRVYEKTAARPGFRFFGNVELGRHVERPELLRRYHAIVYAVGAQSDRRMGIPGEELPGSHPATDFVGWYNGHPDYVDHSFDLSAEHAVVVGNGNVAIDVARMLALAPDELARTDVADHALEALRASRVRDVEVLGRRGPLQAAFTNPELRELGELDDVDVAIDPAELQLDPASHAVVQQGEADRAAVRNLELLRKLAERPPRPSRVTIRLRFGVSPVAILGSERVRAVELCRNELRADPGGAVRAVATDRREVIETGLVLRSIGYRGLPLPGVPFDEQRGVVPNRAGRVVDERGAERPGEYVVGWIKRGPTGIIGTNKKDAVETVEQLLADARAAALAEPTEDPESIEALLDDRAPEHVTFEGWQLIDAHEQQLGQPGGRPRVKLTRVDDMVDVAGRGAGRLEEPA